MEAIKLLDNNSKTKGQKVSLPAKVAAISPFLPLIETLHSRHNNKILNF